MLRTGVPQGCVLSSLLFTFLTRDYAPTYSINHIIKFEDDTTVLGRIGNNDEPIGLRWANWSSGVNLTILSWVWVRPNSDWLQERTATLWPMMVLQWKGWAASNSWGLTPLRTFPALATPHRWPKRLKPTSTSSANWREQEFQPPSCTHSTRVPSKAFSEAASHQSTASCRTL